MRKQMAAEQTRVWPNLLEWIYTETVSCGDQRGDHLAETKAVAGQLVEGGHVVEQTAHVHVSIQLSA